MTRQVKLLCTRIIDSVRSKIASRQSDKLAMKQLARAIQVFNQPGCSEYVADLLYLDYRSGRKDGLKRTPGDAKLLALQTIATAAKTMTEKSVRKMDIGQSQLTKQFEAAKAVLNQPIPEKGPSKIKVVATKAKSKLSSFNWKKIAKVAAVIIGVGLLAWLGIRALTSSKDVVVNNPRLVSEETSQEAPTSCSNSWEMQPMVANPSENKWFEQGVSEIYKAFETKNPDDAKKAFEKWMYGSKDEKIYGVKDYRNQLIPAAKTFLPQNMWPNEDTISKDGECANDATVQLVNAISLAVLGQGKITAENAPVTGYNTGIENGVVVSDANPGISGDLRAIKITLKDGREVWILARCGNLVTHKAVFKHGKTDEKHPHKKCEKNCHNDKPKCKPGQTWNGKVCLTKKDPKADPAQKGNAPKGSGKNQDPGPGAYQAPNEVTKPSSEPRVNPAPPTTSTSSSSSSSSIPKGSTPDPAPAPAPEKAAPTPSKPATGTVSVPGM